MLSGSEASEVAPLWSPRCFAAAQHDTFASVLPFAPLEKGLEAESRIDRPGKKPPVGKGTGFSFVQLTKRLDGNQATLA